MARKIATLLLLFAFGSCMEMRETVERMVMVRTTGSDLQPAATGYIYKKESDSPASVIKMGESEVIEHFSKLYSKPEKYQAPPAAAAGPFHATKEDEHKSASYTAEEHVKPVVEKTDEHEDPIDGLASQDYDKIFEDYAKQYGSGYKDDFADYLHGLGHYDHGIYHGYGDEKDHGSKGYHGYGEKGDEGHGPKDHYEKGGGGAVYHEYGGGKDHGSKGYHGYGEKGDAGHRAKDHYEKGGAGDYHQEKHEGYTISKAGGHKKGYDDADAHGKHYAHGHEYKGNDHGHKAEYGKGEGLDGFHKVYDKKELKKDHDFYDGEGLKGGHHKYADGHASHGSDAGGHEKGGFYDSGHKAGGFGKGGYIHKESGAEHDTGHSAEKSGESHHHHDGKFGAKVGEYDGKKYGYEIKH